SRPPGRVLARQRQQPADHRRAGALGARQRAGAAGRAPARAADRFRPAGPGRPRAECGRSGEPGRTATAELAGERRATLAPHAARLAMRTPFCWIAPSAGPEARMVPFFVQIKCHLGKSYDVANRIADAEIASEIYSTAGDFDLLVKFYVDDETDIGHFVNEKVQTIPGIQDTHTIITFKAF